MKTNYKNGNKPKENSNSTSVSSANIAHATESHMQYPRYHNLQGHGWAAEDANAMNDRLHGKHVEQVGTNNAKNGPDRIVDNSAKIQTKYYASARESVNSILKDGELRYGDMKHEVPSDQYNDAIKILEDKIRNGKVKGVSNPAAAKKMIVKGSCTYQEAKNIAKAGNIDSIKFDVKTQSITCGCTMGLSFLCTFTKGIDSGMSVQEAACKAGKQAAKSGALSMGVGVISQQALRTQTGRTGAAIATKASKEIVNTVYKTSIGKAAVEKAASATVGKQVSGAVAKNVITKSMRTNMVVGTVMFAAETIPDAVRFCKGDISGEEFTKKAATNATGIGSGYVGMEIGATIGSIVPGVGTAIGGFCGAIIGGILGSSFIGSLFD